MILSFERFFKWLQTIPLYGGFKIYPKISQATGGTGYSQLSLFLKKYAAPS
jgi:hypothetical protein